MWVRLLGVAATASPERLACELFKDDGGSSVEIAFSDAQNDAHRYLRVDGGGQLDAPSGLGCRPARRSARRLRARARSS